MKTTLCSLLVALAFLSGGSSAAAADVDLYFSSMEKMVEQQVLIDGGRLYLFGDGDSPCLSAFLANPKVSESAGKLMIRFDFSGSMAGQMGGDCIGLSEEFPLTVMGIPVYEDDREAALACLDDERSDELGLSASDFEAGVDAAFEALPGIEI